MGFASAVKGGGHKMQADMATPAQAVAVIVPASNEEALIGACLGALAGSGPMPGPIPAPVEVIVVANGCRDATVPVARAAGAAIVARGWRLTVLDLPQGGKTGALNAGDAATDAPIRVYLDADVTVSPALLPGIAQALAGAAPAYASGQLRITARGAVARAYARLWARVPFMAQGVPGCGLFAVNATGRARWGDWPDVISDDGFARLMFGPDERHLVPAPYDWPIAEGFSRLVRVRRRQDRGVAQLAERFPTLIVNEDKGRLGLAGLARLALTDPVGFAVYAAVALRVRSSRAGDDWSRGR